MTQEEILTQIDRLKYRYWNCKDETLCAQIENELDYFYDLLEKLNKNDTGR